MDVDAFGPFLKKKSKEGKRPEIGPGTDTGACEIL
jgi:hypothetical protein